MDEHLEPGGGEKLLEVNAAADPVAQGAIVRPLGQHLGVGLHAPRRVGLLVGYGVSRRITDAVPRCQLKLGGAQKRRVALLPLGNGRRCRARANKQINNKKKKEQGIKKEKMRERERERERDKEQLVDS